LIFGAVRLSGVLYHDQTVSSSELEDGLEVERHAVYVDRHDGAGAFGDDVSREVRGHQPGVGINVGENWNGSRVQDGKWRRHEAVGGDDNLITLPDSCASEREVQRARSTMRENRVLGANEVGELVFQSNRFRCRATR
jgi:hypothetical protein